MVSFIIIGKNEGWKLTKCFKSIFDTISHYKLKDTEVIYIDSNSTDDSISRAKAFEKVDIFLITGEINSAVARNVGAKKAKGDILFFLDGDMEIITNNFKYFFNKKMDKLIYPFLSGDFLNHYYKDRLSKEIIGKKPYHDIKNISMQPTTGGLFFIERKLWIDIGQMRSEFRKSQDLDLGLRLSKKGTLLKRLPHILVNHHTVSYRDKKRFLMDMKGGNFLYRGVLYRKNIFNRYILKKFIHEEITLSFLIIALLYYIIGGSVIFMYLYFFLVFIRVLRKSSISNIIQNFIRVVVIDFNTIAGFVFFYPKAKKNYRVETVKQTQD